MAPSPSHGLRNTALSTLPIFISHVARIFKHDIPGWLLPPAVLSLDRSPPEARDEPVLKGNCRMLNPIRCQLRKGSLASIKKAPVRPFARFRSHPWEERSCSKENGAVAFEYLLVSLFALMISSLIVLASYKVARRHIANQLAPWGMSLDDLPNSPSPTGEFGGSQD